MTLTVGSRCRLRKRGLTHNIYSTVEWMGWRGWTEAQSFQSGLGIDSVVFGPGSLKEAHSGNEFVELEQVRLAARIYAQMAMDVLT